jgi:Na+-driven multidrug efflux pump
MSQHFVSKWLFSQEVIETLYSHVQVMIGVYSLCTVTGEPLAQTAQSFMPALIQGSNRNFKQARSLLRSLMLIGAVVGLTLGCMAISVPWFFPQLFTKDPAIIHQVET